MLLELLYTQYDYDLTAEMLVDGPGLLYNTVWRKFMNPRRYNAAEEKFSCSSSFCSVSCSIVVLKCEKLSLITNTIVPSIPSINKVTELKKTELSSLLFIVIFEDQPFD